MTDREPVEIKVNVVGEAESALARRDHGEDSARTIGFLENPGALTGPGRIRCSTPT